MAAMRRHRIRKPSRSEMIAALGLDPEGRKRGQKYAATTKEFYSRVCHGSAPSVIEAREKLGIEHPYIPGSQWLVGSPKTRYSRTGH
jgi:hypothetical protein